MPIIFIYTAHDNLTLTTQNKQLLLVTTHGVCSYEGNTDLINAYYYIKGSFLHYEGTVLTRMWEKWLNNNNIIMGIKCFVYLYTPP